AVSRTRLPNSRAVSRSPGSIAAGEASDGDCAMAPMDEPSQFRSLRCAALELLGSMPVPTQMAPCCMASVTRYCSVDSLSPLMVALLVKPANSLSFQARLYQG